MERQTKRRGMSYLPGEMMEEILSRLPVKSLLRFRCVSKAWRSLIGSKRFMRKQLKDSRINTTLAHQRALLLCHSSQKLYECSVQSLFSKPDIHALEFNFVPSRSMRLVGSCNGLFCIQLSREEFLLWNPSTKIWKKLPNIIEKYEIQWAYGFGCDERSGDYKVVVIFRMIEYSAHVYSLKSNSWKKIRKACDSKVYLSIDQPGKLESGKLHWGGKEGKRRVGLQFDLKREVFETTTRDIKDKSWKRLKLACIVDKCSLVGTTCPSLAKCIDPQGGFKNISSLVIDNCTTSPASLLIYDSAMYIQSLESLDSIS